jgi:hypothetical protein
MNRAVVASGHGRPPAGRRDSRGVLSPPDVISPAPLGFPNLVADPLDQGDRNDFFVMIGFGEKGHGSQFRVARSAAAVRVRHAALAGHRAANSAVRCRTGGAASREMRTSPRRAKNASAVGVSRYSADTPLPGNLFGVSQQRGG